LLGWRCLRSCTTIGRLVTVVVVVVVVVRRLSTD
jgi:hypothetical protein